MTDDGYDKAVAALDSEYSIHVGRIAVLRDTVAGAADNAALESLAAAGRDVEQWIDEAAAMLSMISKYSARDRLVMFGPKTIARIRKLATRVADERATIAECRNFLSDISTLANAVEKTNEDWRADRFSALSAESREDRA